VLPAPLWPDPQQGYAEMTDWVEVQDVQITTYDRVTLCGIQITPAVLSGAAEKNKRYIIKFHGNGKSLSESSTKFIDEATNYQCVIVGFNYRGVTEDSPKATKYQDLVVDGIAQVQRLLAAGVNPENITLDGFSFGGAIATLVAAHCHKNGQKVSLFNDRSFGTLVKEVAGLLTDEVPIFSEMTETSMAPALSLASWSIKASVAYMQIPEQYRGHMFIAPKEMGSELKLGDGVIKDTATLHAQLPKHNHGMCWQMVATHPGHYRAHFYPRGALQTIDRTDEQINGVEVFKTFLNRFR
jgi:hypothetical protein